METSAGLRLFAASPEGVVEFDGIVPDSFHRLIDVPECGTMGDVAVLEDGNLVVTCTESDRLVKIDPVSGDPIEEFLCCADAGEGFHPFAIALAPNGSILAGSTEISIFDSQTGDFLGVAVEEGTAGAATYEDFVFGPEGNLFVSASPDIGVLEFDGVTFDLIGVFVSVGDGGLVSPYGLAFGTDDNLLVADAGNESILQFDGQTGAFFWVFVRAAPNVPDVFFINVRP